MVTTRRKVGRLYRPYAVSEVDRQSAIAGCRRLASASALRESCMVTTRRKVGRLYRLCAVSEVDRQSAIAAAVDYQVLQHLESLSTSIHKLKLEVTDTNDVTILSTTFTKRFINSHTTQLTCKFHDRFVTFHVGHNKEFFKFLTRKYP